MWIHVPNVLKGNRLVPIGLGQFRIVLPPLAVLVVPAGVLKLKPLEIFLGQWIDAPEVGEPASGEELCRLMHIALVRDAVPGLLNVLVVDLQTILLQRHQITEIVVIVDPATTHLRKAVSILATVLST